MNKEQIIQEANEHGNTYRMKLAEGRAARSGFIAGAEYALSQSMGMKWVKASERMPEAGDKRLFFVKGDLLIKTICGLNHKGQFCDFPSGHHVRWEPSEIEWLDESPSSSDRLKEEYKEMLEMLKNVGGMLFENGSLKVALRINALITKIESNGK